MLMVWPMQREGWFARVLPRFANNLDWLEAVWPNRTLLDTDLPFMPMAQLMLALGLAANQPDESGRLEALPLASGIVLQVDQATPAYQVDLRHMVQCRPHASVDFDRRSKSAE